MSAAPTVRPITSNIGAIVEGIDLRHGIEEPAAEVLRQAMLDHLVLVFRGQRLSVDEQQTLIRVFAEPEPHPVNAFLGDTEVVTVIDPDLIRVPAQAGADPADMGDYLAEFPAWHTDASYAAWIPKVASLRAEVLPPVGGDTAWTNLCAAHDGLSALMRSWLAEVSAVHCYGPQFKINFDFTKFGTGAERRFDAAHQPRTYPVVIEHPDSGRRALYVNPAYTASIEGLSRKESKSLLRFLFDHIANQAFVYRHHWQTDDVVIWDELVTLHLSPQDFRPHPRRLVRVAGGRVTPAAPDASSEAGVPGALAAEAARGASRARAV